MYMEQFGGFEEVTERLDHQIGAFGNRVGKTQEITNVFYAVTDPKSADIHPHQLWADVEFMDRTSGKNLNPGHSWEVLPEVWTPMKEADGKYSYTYSERLSPQLGTVIEELKTVRETRQAFLSVWNGEVDVPRFNKRRIPCTFGYQIFIRQDLLSLTYLQRSCNFPKHFQDDVYLAFRLQQWLAIKVEVQVGSFFHYIASLHKFV